MHDTLSDTLPPPRPGFTAELAYCYTDTPPGAMLAVFASNGLCLLEFTGQKHLQRELCAVQNALRGNFVQRECAWSSLLRQELAEYFAGRLKTFATPLVMVGTPFQQSVWRVLQSIPYGQTLSYRSQAAALGKPQAVRAVAAANGQNKISILIPCHRVIGSDGSLTGYAGGLARKRFLLELESGQGFQTAML